MATHADAPRAGGEVGTVGTPVLWTVVSINLAWVAGILGSFMEDASDGQALLWSVAAMAGMTGAALLAVRHVRAGRDLAAAGFAAFAMLSAAETVAGFTGDGNTAVGVPMSVLHLPVALLIAAQDWSTIWARASMAVSGVLFGIYGYQYTLGDDLPDIDSPLLMAAYITLTIAIIGWSMTLMNEES
jgi:hypothetical protein